MNSESHPDSKGGAPLLLPDASTVSWLPSQCIASLPLAAVVILFKQTGDAPILKQNKVKASQWWRWDIR